jgi:hypothetical protein
VAGDGDWVTVAMVDSVLALFVSSGSSGGIDILVLCMVVIWGGNGSKTHEGAIPGTAPSADSNGTVGGGGIDVLPRTTRLADSSCVDDRLTWLFTEQPPNDKQCFRHCLRVQDR